MKTLFLILISTLSAAVLFGSGILIGRQFPAHNYEKIPQAPYLLDTTTGRVCAYLEEDQSTIQSSIPSEPQSNRQGVDFYLKALSKQSMTIPLCK